LTFSITKGNVNKNKPPKKKNTIFKMMQITGKTENVTGYLQVGDEVCAFDGGSVIRQPDGSLRFLFSGSKIEYPVVDFDGTHALILPAPKKTLGLGRKR
jgi:hypothetical protein